MNVGGRVVSRQSGQINECYGAQQPANLHLFLHRATLVSKQNSVRKRTDEFNEPTC